MTTTPDATPPPAANAPRRGGLARLWLALLALLLLAGLGASGWLAWRQSAALPWLLQRVPGLQVQGVQGTLASGQLQIAQLDWQLPGGAGRLQLWDLQMEGARLVLWPRPGAQAALQLAKLHATRAQFTSPPPNGKPLQAPTSLQLPMDLQLPDLAIDALQVDALPAMRQLHASLVLGADGGRLHRVDTLQLQIETGSAEAPAPVALAGQIQIGTTAPMDVQARLQASRDTGPAWQATLQASGPLAKLHAEARLSGALAANAKATANDISNAASLHADATVLPFAAWPLGALQLQTQALNLAALSPRLPQTQLAGRASVLSQGLDQPATLNATIDNRLPGPWDAGRLPLRQLQLRASGRPDQLDRLVLDQFALQLGDAAGNAGRISGQGNWQGDALALTLQTTQLQPARLHRSAAAIELGGPLTLRLRGLPTAAGPQPGTAAANPTLAVDAQLSGRWLDAAGLPVQLRLVGDASAQHLQISQAEARAGTALARLSGEARAGGGGWRVAGQASLANFDPRPWWRGPEGSAWRQGPHRLQAEASAKLLWRPTPAPPTGGPATLAIDRLLAAINGQASLSLADSVLAGVPLAGNLALQSQGTGAQLQGELTVAGNRISVQGQGGGAPAADRWNATLDAPTLATLAPLRALITELATLEPDSAAALTQAWPSAGKLQATLTTQGRWPALQSQGRLQASQLASSAMQLQQATLSWRLGTSSDAPLQLDLAAQGLRSGAQQVDTLGLVVAGTLADHQITLQADSPLRPPAWADALLGPAGSGSQLAARARGQWLPAGASATSATSQGMQSSQGSHRYRLLTLGLTGGARQAATLSSSATTRPAPQASTPWMSAQHLSGEVQLGADGSVQALQLAPGRVQLPGTALNWRTLRWTAGASGAAGAAAASGTLVVTAELETIDVASVLAKLQPEIGWRGDLTLGGQIDIRSNAQGLDADIVLARGQGDLSVTDDLDQAQPLGLSELRLALEAHGGRWRFAQGLVGRRIGTLVGAVELRNLPGQRWPQRDAPLQGLVEARVANLGVWGAWVPRGWRLSGALDTVAQFAGTLAAPRITGTMRGNNLGLRNVLEGVNLTDGQLALQLTGEQARIERFSFQGGDGRLDITGGAELGATPQLTLQLVAERFRLLGRIDRRVVASGRGTLSLVDRRLQIDGGFTIDEGLIDIGRGDAPTLDDDVVVQRGAGAASAAAGAVPKPVSKPVPGQTSGQASGQAPIQMQMQVKLNLGDKLQLRGQGIDTRLRGDLVLSSPGGKLALNGTVSTVNGKFAAYGQKLDISRGRFVFSGDLGNPRIDVLAVRPNLDVQVGVLVDGSAHSPRIRLYSDPELADYDKLSWLVLGRSPDGLGSADTALLQRAAFALLAGNSGGPTDKLLETLGLTDFSLRQTEGDTRDTIISLGKQLSQRWYVGYERGVHATAGTWQLIYRIAQRFTLRAQSGSENAIDLIWTWRW